MENEKPKRKTTTSTAVKARWNKAHYDSVRFSAPKELAAAFKAKSVETGIPQAQIFKLAMREFLADPDRVAEAIRKFQEADSDVPQSEEDAAE